MAVTLTTTQLLTALRMGDTTEETAEATRLLSYATEAVTHHAPDAPDATANEAAVRLAGYLYDAPFASRGATYAAALHNSGAASALAPYREHRAGRVDDEEVEEEVEEPSILPTNPTLYVAWGALQTLSSADFAGASSGTSRVQVPPFTTQRAYLFFLNERRGPARDLTMLNLVARFPINYLAGGVLIATVEQDIGTRTYSVRRTTNPQTVATLAGMTFSFAFEGA